MSTTQMNNVVERIVPESGYSISQNKVDCSTCKHEATNMQCLHPDNGKAKFSNVEMGVCWSAGTNMSTGQQAYKKYGQKNV